MREPDDPRGNQKYLGLIPTYIKHGHRRNVKSGLWEGDINTGAEFSCLSVLGCLLFLLGSIFWVVSGLNWVCSYVWYCGIDTGMGGRWLRQGKLGLGLGLGYFASSPFLCIISNNSSSSGRSYSLVFQDFCGSVYLSILVNTDDYFTVSNWWAEAEAGYTWLRCRSGQIFIIGLGIMFIHFGLEHQRGYLSRYLDVFAIMFDIYNGILILCLSSHSEVVWTKGDRSAIRIGLMSIATGDYNI